MNIKVLRIGERIVRDDRATTHVVLVARALGASQIYIKGITPDISDTIDRMNTKWGGDFKVTLVERWKSVIDECKKNSTKIVHLTMYGQNINDVKIQDENILVIVGAKKVPKEIYDFADYNIAVGNQPHSEVGALAIFLDRIQGGKQFDRKFDNAQMRIIPSPIDKNVVEN